MFESRPSFNNELLKDPFERSIKSFSHYVYFHEGSKANILIRSDLFDNRELIHIVDHMEIYMWETTLIKEYVHITFNFDQIEHINIEAICM